MGKQIQVMLMDEPHPHHIPLHYSRASAITAEFIAAERENGRKPVKLGDPNNTIIFVDERRNSERAAKSFIERVEEHRTSTSFNRRDVIG
jgi:hypothetical protein